MIKDNELILLVILICVLGIISSFIHSYNLFDLVLGFVIAGIGIWIFIRLVKGGTMINKMREYKCVEVERSVDATQDKLNRLAKDNWRVVCSYVEGRYIILERDNLWS